MHEPDVDTQLKLNTQAERDFACNALRVLRHVIKRMQMERRKHWQTKDVMALLDTLIAEISSGVTEEDKIRETFIADGKSAQQAGQARTANPHAADSQYYAWWDTGWRDGERANQTAKAHPMPVVTADNQQRYRVQLNQQSTITEWNETLYMFVEKGGGTVYSDYDEALSLADLQQSQHPGAIVSVVVVETKGTP